MKRRDRYYDIILAWVGSGGRAPTRKIEPAVFYFLQFTASAYTMFSWITASYRHCNTCPTNGPNVHNMAVADKLCYVYILMFYFYNFLRNCHDPYFLFTAAPLIDGAYW